MKWDEIHAARYLESLGHTDLRYEPDGNRPPDFLVPGDIAIEVARLPKLERASGLGVADDDVRTPLLANVLQILDELGPAVDKRRWCVWYRYRRPVPRLRSLKRRVRAWLEDFRDNVRTDSAELRLGPNFTLRVDSSCDGPEAFFLGGFTDHDLGGEVSAMMIESLRHVIDKKSDKVASVLMNHRVWWLLLIDWVGASPSQGTRQEVIQAIRVTPPWNRVILVSVLDHTDAFELEPGDHSR